MKIHFVLDVLDIESVVDKVKENLSNPSRPGPGESITASELRYIYRNRERLENNVIFYRNNEKVNAPWVDNKALWNNYKYRSLSRKASRTVKCNLL